MDLEWGNEAFKSYGVLNKIIFIFLILIRVADWLA